MIDSDETMGKKLQVYATGSGDPMRELFCKIRKAAIENASKIPECGWSESGDFERRYHEGKDEAFDDVMSWMIEVRPDFRSVTPSA